MGNGMARKKNIRKIKLGLAGAPISSWRSYFHYMRYEVDNKEIGNIIKKYIRENFDTTDRKVLLNAPDSIYGMSTGAAASIHWSNLNKEFPSNWDKERSIQIALNNIRHFSKDSVVKSETKKVSPMTLLKEKISDYIGDLECIIDDWENYNDYSLYSELQKNDVSASLARGVHKYYAPLLSELEELVKDKNTDLVEGYSHMSVAKRKRYMYFVEKIVKDAEQYFLGKKATKKPRAVKVKTADTQVTKLKYLTESNEYRLTSINPVNIIGSMRLYTFNTKNRILTEYVSRSPKGFEIKGTTLQMWDEDATRAIRLRKPNDIIPIIQSGTLSKINKSIMNLSTKLITPNGRINQYTILLKVMNR